MSFTQSQEGVPSLSLHLMSQQPHPTTCVDFQLWIANDDHPENSLQKGEISLTGAHHLCCTKSLLVFAVCMHNFTDGRKNWGWSQFSSQEAVLQVANGFVRDGVLLLGAHISVQGVSNTDACACSCTACEYTTDVVITGTCSHATVCDSLPRAFKPQSFPCCAFCCFQVIDQSAVMAAVCKVFKMAWRSNSHHAV